MSEITITTDRESLEGKLYQLANIGDALSTLDLDRDDLIEHVESIVSNFVDSLTTRTPLSVAEQPNESEESEETTIIGYAVRNVTFGGLPGINIHRTREEAQEWLDQVKHLYTAKLDIVALIEA